MTDSLTSKQLWIFILLWVLGLLISVYHCTDLLTWFMEVLPVMIAAVALRISHDRFPLPRYVLFWIFLHGVVLMLGGHYTYAEVPVGFSLQEWLHLSRNPYDRIGHLMQGFVPALVAREILVRKVKV